MDPDNLQRRRSPLLRFCTSAKDADVLWNGAEQPRSERGATD
jgi:hypothetical protein